MTAESAPRPAAENPALLDAYLDELRLQRNLSPHTLRNYRTDLSHFLHYLGDRGVLLAEVSRPTYRLYLDDLRAAGIAQGSLRRRASTIKSFFKHLFHQRTLPSDPLRLAGTPKTPRTLPRFLSVGEVEALIAAPDLNTPAGLRDRAILEVLYGSGLRVSELVTLRLQSIDWENAFLRVHGKGDRERAALLGEQALAALEDYVRQGRTQLAGESAEDALWLNRFGGSAFGPGGAAGGAALRDRGGAAEGRAPAPVATLLRHSYARTRRRCAGGPGIAGAFQCGDDADLYARDGVGEAGGYRNLPGRHQRAPLCSPRAAPASCPGRGAPARVLRRV